MFDGGLLALVVRRQSFIQIAAMETTRRSPLVCDAHAMDLKFGPHGLGGSSRDPVRIEYHQRRFVIPVVDSSSDDLLPPVAVKVGQGHEVQLPGMPILGDGLAVGTDDGDLVGIPGNVMARNDDSSGCPRRPLSALLKSTVSNIAGFPSSSGNSLPGFQRHFSLPRSE